MPLDLAMDEHKVLKATISNGESYALDIAGAQFGLHTAVVPRDQYVDLHVCQIHGSEDIVLTRAKAGFSRLEKGDHLPEKVLKDVVGWTLTDCHEARSNTNQISDSLEPLGTDHLPASSTKQADTDPACNPRPGHQIPVDNYVEFQTVLGSWERIIWQHHASKALGYRFGHR